MKKFKRGFILLFIISFSLFLGNLNVKAEIGEQQVDSYESIPPLESQDYIWESETNMKKYDVLKIFTGEAEGWIPRIKFEGTDKDNIYTYLFCLSYHDLAPSTKVEYSLATWDTAKKMNEIRYIMEHGFGYEGADYGTGDKYANLVKDYYITQVAIWQLQGDYGYEVGSKRINVLTDENEAKYNQENGTENSGDAAKAYQKIKELVTNAKDHTNANPINNKRMIAKFVPTNAYGYQILTPFKIYVLPEPQTETHKCEQVGDLYYDKNGSAVSQEDYEDSCLSKPTCTYKNGTYYDDKGNEVTQTEYKKICETTIEPNIKITYKDKCTNEHVGNAKMKLVKGTTCSGTVVKSWTSGQIKTFDDIDAGNYMICDTTNNYNKSIAVRKTNSLQEFEMYTNPDTCDEPAANEEKPPTGVASSTLIGLVLIITVGGYMYLKKHDKFIKIK